MLAASYIVGCLLMALMQQASATSYTPLPERKPAAASPSALIKVTLPAPKPEITVATHIHNENDTRAQSDKDATSRMPVPPKKPLPVHESGNKGDNNGFDLLGRATRFLGLEQNKTPESKPSQQSFSVSDAKTADKAIAEYRPIPASEAPYPIKKPLSENKPLSRADALLYNKIFSYQATAHWEKANELLGELTDLRLRGHVLFQRYMHPTSYITTFNELNGWMNAYADHPGADRIYKLALAKMPDDFKGHIRQPENKTYNVRMLGILYDKGKHYSTSRNHSAQERKDIAKLQSAIRNNIARGRPTQALKALETSKATSILDPVIHDRLKAQIANSYMLVGKLQEAKPLALSAAQRSSTKAPQAGWVGGLLAWREHNYKLAAALFTQPATSPYSSSWAKSAGSYWASRAYMRAGDIQDVSLWLERAAQHPRTFYGMIATKALGWDHDFNWNVPSLTQDHVDALAKEKAGLRAIALVAAGQHHLAEAELKNLNMRANPKLGEALLAYTVHEELPSFALRIAETTPHPQGGVYDAALYPLSPWSAKTHYGVDKAMIHALIRQESRFNPFAESRSGATGLMQIMPRTASFVSGNSKYRTRKGQHALKDPRINLEIGEKYIHNLLRQSAVNSELFSLAIAYNAGPGNLRKWKRELSDIKDDPLLFVESIPMAETRAFVERVMAFYWIYRMRLDQPTPSLQAVAEGAWPKYVRMDDNNAVTRKAATTNTPAPTSKPAQRPVKTAHNTSRYAGQNQ